MTEETILNDGDSAKYFAQIMHMADDDLDPYQYRLYGHYLRVCGGSSRPCTQGVRKIAEITRMSVGKVTESRYQLATLGFITIHTEEKYDGIAVTINDRWMENIQRYSKPESCSPDERSVHTMNTPCSPDELKNNLSLENNLKKDNKDSATPEQSQSDMQPAASSPVGEGTGQNSLVIPDVLTQANDVVAQKESENPLPSKLRASNSPDNMPTPKEKVPRKRKGVAPDLEPPPITPLYQRFFKGVALICFGIDANKLDEKTRKRLDKSSSRIGLIASWLYKDCEATPEQLWQFAQDYKQQNDGINLPRDKEKFIEHWTTWQQKQQGIVLSAAYDTATASPASGLSFAMSLSAHLAEERAKAKEQADDPDYSPPR